ncbi:MAG: hypothetical protein WDN48_01950 [Pseudolabrys sp.]
MVAVTFGSGVATPATPATPATAEVKTAKKGKGFFARVFAAMMDAQMKRAERELLTYRHLLPRDFKLDTSYWTREENVPFGGW